MTKDNIKTADRGGFTLIELSIVLVIIGLIIGGILTGQSLIETATLRAQVSQIVKYQAAVRTFQGKYGYLPGDIPAPYATNFGFSIRGTGPGQGDGDGFLEGDYDGTDESGAYFGIGETPIFWADLSSAGLIDAGIQSYDVAGTNYPSAYHNPTMQMTLSTTPSVYQWLPQAKLGNGNFVYVYSYSNMNLFAVSSVAQLRDYIFPATNPGITVQQAYNIDSKVDDGLPLTGAVNVCYTNGTVYPGVVSYAAGGGLAGANNGFSMTLQRCNPPPSGVTRLSTNCYDDNGGTLPTMQYALANATVPNCALSFRFQ